MTEQEKELSFIVQNTWIGDVLIASSQNGVCALYLPRSNPENLIHKLIRSFPGYDIKEDMKPNESAIEQLNAYFQGKRKKFTIKLDPLGTPFQQKVWQAVREVPYGETRSYGDIARQINNPGASRAVGLANRNNPIPIFIPCHRIIGSDGSMTGYGSGIPLKKKLLNLENGIFE